MSATNPNSPSNANNSNITNPSSSKPSESHQQTEQQQSSIPSNSQSQPITTPSATDIRDSAQALLAVSASRPNSLPSNIPSPTLNHNINSQPPSSSTAKINTNTSSTTPVISTDHTPKIEAIPVQTKLNNDETEKKDQVKTLISASEPKSEPVIISTSVPISNSTVNPIPSSSANVTPTQLPAVGANDVIFVNGEAFNGRGYRVCGVANQRGRLCGRIGTCPFHAGKPKGKLTPKRPRASANTLNSANQNTITPEHTTDEGQQQLKVEQKIVQNDDTTNDPSNSNPNSNVKRPRLVSQDGVRQMTAPPQKSRFKRSWTTEEHVLFLQAMRKHGKGKWKEISREVKTRTANQCQSHAQKYFLRQAKSDSERKKKSIHDVTEKDMPETGEKTKANSKSQTNAASSAGGEKTDSATTQALTKNSGTGVNTQGMLAVPLAPRPTIAGVRVTSDQIDVGSSSTRTPGDNIVGNTTGGISLPLTTAVRAQSIAPLTNGVQVVSSTGSMSTVPVVIPMHGIQYAPMMQQFLTPGLANPGAAAVIAPPPPAKLRVTVHINGKLKGGMTLVLPDEWEQFFEIAKAKLSFTGSFKRVFVRSGGEITSLDEMCQDDMLWLSPGEDFLTPR